MHGCVVIKETQCPNTQCMRWTCGHCQRLHDYNVVGYGKTRDNGGKNE
jgi:hypothetical protein